MQLSLGKRRAVVIDGQNLFIRNFVVNPTLDSNGEPVGGVVGTLRSVASIARDMKPSSLVVCWDGEGGSRKRRTIYSEYKAGRKVRLNREYDDLSTPRMDFDNMVTQLKLAKEYLDLAGVRQAEVQDCEADDVIAYAAETFSDCDVTIVSTDRDFLQLVDDRVNVWSPIKKKLYTRDAVLEEFGVLPENFVLWKAIVGDDSDNIGGIKGVGGKSVPKMFPFLAERTSTVDEVVSHAVGSSSSGKRFVTVAESRGLLTRNLELMALKPLAISAASMRSAREQLSEKRKCRPFELRTRMVRDGITASDADVFNQLSAQHAREEANG